MQVTLQRTSFKLASCNWQHCDFIIFVFHGYVIVIVTMFNCFYFQLFSELLWMLFSIVNLKKKEQGIF